MLRNLAKSVVAYGFGDLFVKLFGFLTLPIYTRFFSPAEYGTLSFIGSGIAVMAALGGMGMNSAVQREYYHSTLRRRLIVSTGFWTLLIGTITAAIIFFLTGNIFTLYNNEYSFGLLLLLCSALIIPFQQLFAFNQDLIRLLERPWVFNFLNVIQQMTQVGVGITLVALLEWGIEGILLGMVAGSCISFIASYHFVRDFIRFKLSKRAAKGLVGIGIPLAFAGLSFPVFTLVDRFLVAYIVDESAVGLLAVAMSFAQMMILLNGSFGKAWSPIAWNLRHNNPNYREIFGEVLLYIIVFFGIFAITLGIFAQEILYILVADEYLIAWVAIPPLLIYMVASASTQITALGINIAGKTRNITYLYWSAVPLNFLLDIILIPQFGYLGAAVGTAIAEISLSIGLAIMGQKLHPLSYPVKRIFIASVIITLAMTGTYYFSFSSNIETFGLKILYILSIVSILFVFRVFKVEHILFVKDFVLSRR